MTTMGGSSGLPMDTLTELYFRRLRKLFPWRFLRRWPERYRLTMWSSTSTLWPTRSLKLLNLFFTLAFLGKVAMAQSPGLRPPADVAAGSAAVISTAGQGEVTVYLMGPSYSTRKQVLLEKDIQLQPNETRTAGRYLAILGAE